jgi:hypothetical protein
MVTEVFFWYNIAENYNLGRDIHEYFPDRGYGRFFSFGIGGGFKEGQGGRSSWSADICYGRPDGS